MGRAFFVGAFLFSVILPRFCLAEMESFVYQVRTGDTVWSVARQYGVEPREIMQLNHLRNPRRLEVGQRLRIPASRKTRAAPTSESPAVLLDANLPRPLTLPFLPQQDNFSDEKFKELTLLCSVPDSKLYNWKYIVIHHSATPNGGARAFDAFHRSKRHMQNGLAYHFVIGNGNGARDGQIEVGPRWRKQQRGGHCSNQEVNEVGIGICLVGNFESAQPTRRQMSSLLELVKYLQNVCHIPSSHVILHREVKQKSTLCPGRRFPADTFRRLLSYEHVAG